MVPKSHRAQLEGQGFVVLPQFISPEHCDELRRKVDALFDLEGEQAGAEFKQEPGSQRLANLVNKGDAFREMIAHPKLLPYLEVVLGARFKLSSLNARTALPNNQIAQPLHADMGAIPDESGYWVCNTVWMLDDFTSDNGPTRVVAGSHRLGRLPTQEDQERECELVTGMAGTVVVMNAHLWHGGSENQTKSPRRALHGFYCRWDKPQQQYQKQLLSEAVQSSCSAIEREILALDDEYNDKVSREVTVRSGFMK